MAAAAAPRQLEEQQRRRASHESVKVQAGQERAAMEEQGN